MKTYITLIKQVKAAIQEKQKELDHVYRDKTNLEHQIEHLVETFEREQIEIAMKKSFVNPKYFDRVSNKIKAYRHLLQSKIEEFTVLQDEIFNLFSQRKQYEILLHNWEQKMKSQRAKREMQEIEDIFRPDVR
jgi:chromosome segregation ATPase